MYILVVVSYVVVWNEFPRRLRKNRAFRHRLKSLLTALALNHLLPIAYMVITKAIRLCPTKLQWTVALALPLYREFTSWMIARYAQKASHGDVRSTEIVCGQSVGSGYAITLIVAIGSFATIETSSVLLSIDLLINIYICCKIIYLKTKSPMKIDQQISLIQELVVNELVEFMLPLAYLGCLLLGYYGPNSELIGGLKSGYWQYSPIEDIAHTIKIILIFFWLTWEVFLCPWYCYGNFAKSTCVEHFARFKRSLDGHLLFKLASMWQP